MSPDWIEDSTKEHGKPLKGPYAHWCFEWDEMTVSARTPEFMACRCYRGVIPNLFRSYHRLKWRIYELLHPEKGDPF